MIKPVSATVLLQKPNGTILMQLRDDGGGKRIPFPNTWNFPGGIVERDEQPVDAAVREIAEEFEIAIKPADLKEVWIYTHEHASRDHIFLCPVPAETRPVLHEGAAFAWMTLEEIAGLELGFDQAKIVAHLSRRLTR